MTCFSAFHVSFTIDIWRPDSFWRPESKVNAFKGFSQRLVSGAEATWPVSGFRHWYEGFFTASGFRRWSNLTSVLLPALVLRVFHSVWFPALKQLDQCLASGTGTKGFSQRLVSGAEATWPVSGFRHWYEGFFTASGFRRWSNLTSVWLPALVRRVFHSVWFPALTQLDQCLASGTGNPGTKGFSQRLVSGAEATWPVSGFRHWYWFFTASGFRRWSNLTSVWLPALVLRVFHSVWFPALKQLDQFLASGTGTKGFSQRLVSGAEATWPASVWLPALVLRVFHSVWFPALKQLDQCLASGTGTKGFSQRLVSGAEATWPVSGFRHWYEGFFTASGFRRWSNLTSVWLPALVLVFTASGFRRWSNLTSFWLPALVLGFSQRLVSGAEATWPVSGFRHWY